MNSKNRIAHFMKAEGFHKKGALWKRKSEFINDFIKQEAHGLHRSPEKPVQINDYIEQSYDYIYYKIYPVIREEEILNLVNVPSQF